MRPHKLSDLANKAHAMTVSELAEALQTNIKTGLNEKQVKSRLKEYGSNTIAKQKDKSVADVFLSQLKSPLVIILFVAFVLSLAFFGLLNALTIFIALVLNILIGFYQEKKADKIFKTLSEQVEDSCTVVRDSQHLEIKTEDLTIGDIVILEAGRKVPADMRLFDVQNLRINESVLTGEWQAVEKHGGVMKEDCQISDCKNMAYAGTLSVDGMAKGIVIAVGENTEFGKISASLESTEKLLTPIQKKIVQLSKYISFAVLLLVVSISALALYRGIGIGEVVLLAVALAVAAVPEGLPAAIAVTLAVGMQRILKKGGLVKYPAAAETLGSVDFVLTDKTGTLTRGQMTLTQLRTISSLDKNIDIKDNPDALLALRAAVLASDAFFKKDDTGEIRAHGRPIEKAIINKAKSLDIFQTHLFENGFERLDFVPFSSKRRFAISLNKDPELGAKIYLSGAPETLVNISKFVLKNGESVLFTDEMKKSMQDLQRKLSSLGMRMTAVAFVKQDGITDELKDADASSVLPATFLGFLVFEDLVRDSVPQAVLSSKKMSVEVMMLTGDHQETAFSIAQSCHIAESPSQVVSGEEFSKMDDQTVMSRIRQVENPLRVFARMLPEHKLRMAKLLQARGFVIAMTGDGINDAPALSAANIGIAVESGTDVAKAAADMILLKNSFTGISFAIKEGRRVLINIYKIIVYLLSTAAAETVLIGTALVLGGPLPLLPAQLLWHNIIEGGLMNFPFAFDKTDKKSGKLAHNMSDFEKKHYLFSLYLAVLFTAVLLGIYGFMLQINFPLAQLRTVLFITFSTTGFMLALSLRNIYKPLWRAKPFSNPYLNLAITFNMLLLVLLFSIPQMREFLSLAVPDSIAIELIVFASFVKWMGIELIKYFVFADINTHAKK